MNSSSMLLDLVRFSQDVVKRLDANLSIHGVSFSEYQVLHHLACSAAGALPRVELARLVGLTPSGVTRMLAPMEKIGLVKKESHARDARMSLVKLTKAGEIKYQDTTTMVGQVADSFVESLGSDRRDILGTVPSHPW
ncbi:MAG: MarR family winged helix-turn-helix transcriptional regulator [Rhodothermales bacterium]